MEKKEYIEPEIEISLLEMDDIIVTSGGYDDVKCFPGYDDF